MNGHVPLVARDPQHHIGVRLPALRERPEDILDLAEELLARERKGLVLAEDAKAALRIYPFPGNVRELGNAMKRAAAVASADGVVHAEDLQLDPIAAPEAQGADAQQVTGARAFTYPAEVIELARRALVTGEVPRPEELTRRRARAFVRAAFVYLKCEEPQTPWPASLRAQFERTFGPRWGEAEDGRGRADLMAALGVKGRGVEAERGFLEVLTGVGIGL